LQARAAGEVAKMFEAGSGSFFTVNMTAGGRLVAIFVVIHILTHKASGRRYAVGLNSELDDVISVKEVCRRAIHHESISCEKCEQFQKDCSELLSKDDVVVALLHARMDDVWEAKAVRTLSVRRGFGPKLAPFHSLKSLPTISSIDSTEASYLDKLEFEGYKLGSLIARSRWNRSAKVVQAQKGTSSFAIKCVSENDDEISLAGNLRDEYNLLKSLAHPSVVEVFDCISGSDGCAMIMKHVHGRRLCQSMPKLSDNMSWEIMSQILSALVYLHDHHSIAHRDLKGENILVSNRGEDSEAETSLLVKVIDFGSARRYSALSNCKSGNRVNHSARKHGDVGISNTDVNPASPSSGTRSRLNSLISSPFERQESTASSFHDCIDSQILPPPHDGGRGDPCELDVFAAGLIFAGLLSKREMFTSDVFTESSLDHLLDLRIPKLSAKAETYARCLLHPSRHGRPKIEAALSDLPPAAAWFVDSDVETRETPPAARLSVNETAAKASRASGEMRIRAALQTSFSLWSCIPCLSV
jgi:serine/threonine protein kinase